MKQETKIIHKGRKPIEHKGTVNPPIYQSSTIIFPNNDAYQKAEMGERYYKYTFGGHQTDHSYGISGNDTTSALQEVLIDLEKGAKSCYLTSSGLSAITMSLTCLLEAGDHLLMVDNVYSPTRRFCNKILKKNNVETTYYNPKIEDIEELVKDNTKVIFLESPGSLTFEVQDFEKIIAVAKKHDIYTVIDNSWATPLFFNPIDIGIDVSIHAITKYINGHSDLLLGAVFTNEKLSQKMGNTYKNLGICTSPFEAYQALRGLRTLKARLDYQKFSLDKVISYLETRDEVAEILCPSYEKFSDYELWKKYFKGTTSLFSIVLDKDYDYDDVCKMIDSYKYISVGASWGGYESLVRHFNLDNIRSEVYERFDGKTMIRYYLGLESADDLIEDFERGFELLK